MIMRKNNNRKTKILWTLSPFPSCFLAWCSLRQILIRVNWMWEEEGGVASLWDFQWQLNVSCLQKLSSWSSAPSEPPACSKSPSKPLWTCHKKSTFTPSTYSFGRLIHWQLRSDYEFCVSEACRTLTIGCVTSVQLRMECVDILEHWEMYLINKNKRPKPNKYEPCHLSTSAQKHKIILYFWNTLTHITVSKFYALNVLKNALCIYGINACLFLCHMVWIYGQFAWCKLKKKKKKSTHLVQQPRWQGPLGQLALAGYELCLLSVYEACTKFPIGGMYATVAQAL